LTNQFFIVGGTFLGRILIFEILNGDLVQYAHLEGGHTSQIRSFYWDTSNNVIVSGADDGKLCVWGISRSQLNMNSNLKSTRESERFVPF